ncbi:MAG: [Clostridia bacterium]|nr:[citrate (pro-3S)-lyase] ligase [Clostridia bacterium]
MEIELTSRLNEQKLNIWKDFLKRCDLEADTDFEQIALLWDDGELIASGCRRENLLKCIAVDKNRRGEDLTAKVLTALRQEAFNDGHRHLFLYTKPHNRDMFSSLFFYPVAQTDKVLLMENKKDGIKEFMQSLKPAESTGIIGAAVMNCNPFTNGHRYLIEKAAAQCGRLYVFVLSEDKSRFSAEDRFNMVKAGTSDLENVTVLPTGPYLISSATFPTYFLKEREKAGQIQCLLDIEIFTKYFVPRFSISRRYVGTEPLSQMTNQYNRALCENLPKHQIEVVEIPRLELEGTPVSASEVRKYIDNKNIEKVRELVPESTFNYVKEKGLI